MTENSEPSDALVVRCVTPFYLHMMNRNVLDSAVDYEGLAAAAAETTDEEVIALLRGHWRPRVMGAWLSAGRVDGAVKNALLEGLSTSLGSLTAPPLATMAVLIAGDDAMPALMAYQVNDLLYGWGSAGFVAAAAEHLRSDVELAESTDADRRALEQMLTIGRTLG